MDAEQVAVFKNLLGVVQRAQGLRPSRTVHRKHAHGREPPLLEAALNAFAFEVFGLAHEMNHARACYRQQRVVNDRKMVRRDNRPTLARNIFKPFDSWIEPTPCDRTQGPDEKPVEHEGSPSQRLDLTLVYSGTYD